MGERHQFHPSILREYDIRGIIGETLGTEDARSIGTCFGSLVRRAGGARVSVGYDGRHSSPALEEALVEGLTGAGVDVVCIGCGPTPMLYYSVYELGTDGAIMITGSHNPPNYNGFKMMLGRRPFFGADIQRIGAMAATGDHDHGAGTSERVDLLERYVARLAQGFGNTDLKIAWDPGNGAAGDVLARLLDRLPGEHVLINAEIDGDFPNHHPDPTVEKYLTQLKQAVAAHGCDLGIAFDGDGDRVGAIDGRGRVVWGDQILIILAREMLKKVPGGTIIADVKASQVLFDEIARAGGKPLMWKTGHSLIKAKMAEIGSPLAGEMSGHIFFKHDFYGFDDALYAAVRLVEAVTAQGGDLAALKDDLPAVINTPEMRFDCPEERKFAVVNEVKTRLAGGDVDVIDVDGVRVKTDDGWWLLRASNTQAVLVARCEARDEAGLARLKATVAAQLEQSGLQLPVT